MSTINMCTWAQQIIDGGERVALPIMTHPGIEFLNRKVSEAVSNGQVHFEAIKALNERYPAAACCTIMDLTVEAEAFGAQVSIPDDEIPTVTGRLLSTYDDVQNLRIPDLGQGRIPEFLKACRLAAEAIKYKPVLGGMIGPFSLAGRLYDMSELMIACYCEPGTATLLLEKCSEFLKIYCREIKKQGVAGIVIAEPAAGLLSDDGCREFSSSFVKQIVDEVQDDNFMVVLHNCGNTGHCTAAMIETGAMGYHFGNKIDMVEAIRGCPEDSLVMGNLDPVTVFKSSSREKVGQAVRILLEATEAFPNFILSSGCDIPPHIPIENIDAFYQALYEFNTK